MTDGKHKSLADRIVHAGIIVAIAHFCLKFAGLIQVKAQGYFLESDQYEVLYVAAFQGVIWKTPLGIACCLSASSSLERLI